MRLACPRCEEATFGYRTGLVRHLLVHHQARYLEGTAVLEEVTGTELEIAGATGRPERSRARIAFAQRENPTH